MKKGFTLIELLAVILILGIIALIAIPVVNNIIKEAKEKAEMRSIEGYAQSLENAYYMGLLKEADVDITALIPNYKGSKVNCQTKEIVNEKIVLTNCNVEGSTNLYNYSDDEVRKSNEEFVEPADNELIDSTTPVFTLKRDYGNTQKVSIRYPEGYTNQYSLDNGTTWNSYTTPLTISKSAVLSARTSSNNVAVGTNNYNAATKSTCTYSVGTVFTYEYKNKEQELATCDGKYKLETWGASGGTSSTYAGGEGAYAVGTVNINKSETSKLFINVGGQGTNSNNGAAVGGYNGGGQGFGTNGSQCCSTCGNRLASSGGGATTINLVSGLLNTLESRKDKILIVAAGGGGGYYQISDNIVIASGTGGAAGGIKGNSSKSTTTYSYNVFATGGSQEIGGKAGYGYTQKIEPGLFGTATKTGTACNEKSGGGGGYYGGGAGYWAPGAGGSSYIGNTKLTNKAMYCYNKCEQSNDINTKTIATDKVSTEPVSNYAKKGNGYAKITYLGN